MLGIARHRLFKNHDFRPRLRQFRLQEADFRLQQRNENQHWPYVFTTHEDHLIDCKAGTRGGFHCKQLLQPNSHQNLNHAP